MTDCGLPYGHHKHWFRTPKTKKIKACDGVLRENKVRRK